MFNNSNRISKLVIENQMVTVWVNSSFKWTDLCVFISPRCAGLPGPDHGREQGEPDSRGGAATGGAGLGAAVQSGSGSGEGGAGAAAGAGPEPPGACKSTSGTSKECCSTTMPLYDNRYPIEWSLFFLSKQTINTRVKKCYLYILFTECHRLHCPPHRRPRSWERTMIWRGPPSSACKVSLISCWVAGRCHHWNAIVLSWASLMEGIPFIMFLRCPSLPWYLKTACS